MRLWTAMLGAWLAAGSGAGADVAPASDRPGARAPLDRPPAAERPAEVEERREAAPARAASGT